MRDTLPLPIVSAANADKRRLKVILPVQGHASCLVTPHGADLYCIERGRPVVLPAKLVIRLRETGTPLEILEGNVAPP